MKSVIFTLLFSFTAVFATSQNLEPVTWTFEVNQNKDATYTFTAIANIDDKWAVYSQHTGEGGPIPLKFKYENVENLVGKTKEESEAIKKMSVLFEVEVIKFKNEAIFTQTFIPTKGQKNIKGYLTFMCCDSKRCLPPTDVEFDVAL